LQQVRHDHRELPFVGVSEARGFEHGLLERDAELLRDLSGKAPGLDFLTQAEVTDAGGESFSYNDKRARLIDPLAHKNSAKF
jgi:hypothetical protein